MPDFGEMFLPDTPPLEIFLRGSIMYLAIFILLRVVLKRASGAIGMTDLIVIVVIADAAQNAMSADYKSVSDGLLLVATIVGWAYALDWLGYRFPNTIGKFTHPEPLPLVEDGKLMRRNLRQEFITEDELWTQLRLQGIEELDEVKRASLEGNGEISIVKAERGGDDAPKQQSKAAAG